MTAGTETSFEYIDTEKALRSVAARIKNAAHVAVDTEANSLHRYFERVCLIQLTIDGEHFIVDPLVDLDYDRFMRVLGGKKLFLHGADYDLRMLRASFDFSPRGGVFDTMVAAQLLGYEQFGLAALASHFCDVTLSKDGQKSDWTQRPLSASQLRYASDDTRYLETIADGLKKELESLGRLAWHDEACARVVEASASTSTRDPDDEWRIRGLGKLKRREVALARELWYWRDKESQCADRPPFKVLGNRQLIELAIWAVVHPRQGLDHGPSLPRNCTGRRFKALERAVQRGRGLSESQWPEVRRHKQPGPYEPECRELTDALRTASAKVAEGLKIEPAVLGSKAAMATVARNRPESVEEMVACGPIMKWQAELLAPVAREVYAKFDGRSGQD